MRMVPYVLVVVLLTTTVASADRRAQKNTDEVEQLKNQLADLTKLVEQMRKEHQEQIAEL